MAEVALTPHDALYDALSLGERVGQLARANSLHAQDGSVVLSFDSKTEEEARADTELARRLTAQNPTRPDTRGRLLR